MRGTRGIGTALRRRGRHDERGAAARAAVTSDGPVSVQRSQQDRCQGPGFRAGAFPRRGAEPRLCGALCACGRSTCRRWMSAGWICSTATSSASRRKIRSCRPRTTCPSSCHGDGAFLKYDQDGRITVSDFIREHTGITTEVAFVGRGNFFQIWEPGRLARLWRGGAGPAFTTSAGDEAWGATGMMAGHGGDSPAVGGPARHIPVLLAEVLAALAPQAGRDRHRRHVRRRRLHARDPRRRAHRVVGVDRDPDAIAAGRATGSGVAAAGCGWCRRRSRTLDEHAEAVDGVVLDIGVSSMQLDEAERGFSFRADGPLDMRMAQAGPTRRRRRQPLQGRRSRPHLRLSRRGAACRPHRPDDREAPRRRGRSRRTLDLADAIETHRRAQPEGQDPSGDARVPGAAHLRQRRARRTGAGAAGGRARAEARRPAGRRDLPFARGPHRQALHRRPLRQRRRARAICRRSREQGADLRQARRRGGGRARRRSRPIRARARPSCAPRSAPTRRRGASDFSIFGLPKLPDIRLSAER